MLLEQTMFYEEQNTFEEIHSLEDSFLFQFLI